MDPKTIVLRHLDEAHALESALVTNLRAHIAMASDGSYRKLLEKHLEETQEQVRAIDRRRTALGGDEGRGIVAASASFVRDAIGQAIVLTKGPIDAVRATNSAERQLKNAKDECATEALEIATYDALEAAADVAGDGETAKLARDHRAVEERTLAALRKEIPRLAEADMRAQVGDADLKKASGAKRSSSSSSSSSPRSKTARGKASASSSGSSSRTTRSRSSSSRASSGSSGSSRSSGSRTSSGSSRSSTSGGSSSSGRSSGGSSSGGSSSGRSSGGSSSGGSSSSGGGSSSSGGSTSKAARSS